MKKQTLNIDAMTDHELALGLEEIEASIISDINARVTHYFKSIKIEPNVYGLETLKDLLKRYDESQDKFIIDILGIRSIQEIESVFENVRDLVESKISWLRSETIKIEHLVAIKQKKNARVKTMWDRAQRAGFWMLLMLMIGVYIGSYVSSERFSERLDEAVKLGRFIHPKTGKAYDVSIRP